MRNRTQVRLIVECNVPREWSEKQIREYVGTAIKSCGTYGTVSVKNADRVFLQYDLAMNERNLECP